MQRVGYGVDMLRFIDGGPLELGGVEIPSERGLDGPGHGDVLARAAIDAFLGACAFCDPGPAPVAPGDDHPAIDTLTRVAERAAEVGSTVVNLDATLLIRRPRISRYLDKMRVNLANALRCEPNVISIKERSPEGLGPAGRGESVEARVVLLLDLEQDR